MNNLAIYFIILFSIFLSGCAVPEYNDIRPDKTWEIISTKPVTFKDSDWEVYSSTKKIRTIANFNGKIFAGTEGGILILEKEFDEFKISRKLTTENGLSSNYITCSALEIDNDIWFGTKNMGLIRIDSREITCFKNLHTPAANVITDIKIDQSGKVWFTTLGAGLYLFENDEFYNFTVSENFQENSFTNLAINQNDEIFCSTINQGIYKFNFNQGFEKFTKFKIPEIINDLEVDKQDFLWIAAIDGLYRISNDNLKTFNKTTGLNSNYISSIFIDNTSGKLFSGTIGRGINVVEDSKIRDLFSSNQLENDNINCIFLYENNIFIGTDNGLIILRNLKKFTRLKNRNEIGGNIITSIEFDNDAIWVGTFYSGAGVYKNGRWRWLVVPKDIPSNEVNAIKKIKNNIWIGTSSGLVSLGKETNFLINKKTGLPSSHVTSITFNEKTDEIIIGTNRGIGIFRDSSWSIRNIYSGLHNDNVMCLSILNNDLYVGTLGGLEIRENNKFLKFDVNNSKINNNQISDVTLWGNKLIIGTFGGGITIREKDNWQNLSVEEGLSSEEINPNSFLNLGNFILMGVGGRGVDIFDGNNFININWEDGLKSENIFNIKERNGKIYFGTENGLYVINSEILFLNIK